MKIARVFRVLAFSVALTGAGGSALQAFGNGLFVRNTVYGSPVATSWTVPTAYVWPTSYYVPTVYAAPYTVSPTAYVVPTYYSATSFAGRTTYYSPTTYAYYAPTAYYWPTTYVSPSVAYYVPSVVDYAVVTASNDCDQSPTRIVRATPSPAASSGSSSGAGAPPRAKPPASLDSEASGAGMAAPDGSVSSRVDKPAAAASSTTDDTPPPTPAPPAAGTKTNAGRLPNLEEKPDDTAVTPTPISSAPSDEKNVSPPNPPAAERDPAKKTSDVPPLVPAPPEDNKSTEVPLELPSLPETRYRKAQKPVAGAPSAFLDNVLHGIVKSGSTGDRVEGVPITLKNRSRTYEDRVRESDAYGRFAIRIPDGDWDVLVTMPSGRVFAVSRLTVMNGKIIDDLGRNVPSLIITR